MLTDHAWKLKYTPEDGDLVRRFYVPALEDAERYDRLTGYFNAGALSLAARGIEGLVRNGGRMRLVVGCTLEPPEIEAIERGETLRGQVESHLAGLPLAPPDREAADALQLLAWMVGRGHLDVKVAARCGAGGRPVHDSALFHEKTGIIEDRGGDRIAWTGSLNETAAGWRRNWESISVYTSWGPEPERVDHEERSFARLWAGRSARVLVLDVPEAVRRDLMRFMPEDLPDRLRGPGGGPPERAAGGASTPTGPAGPAPETLEEADPWDLVVLDEAHHARRRAAGAAQEGGPNALLRLMRSLKDRTQGLVLLTATPMQVHPVEVWDLLSLLGLPPEWTADAFLRFFDDLDHPNPPPEAMERLARLFRAVEGEGGGGGDRAAKVTDAAAGRLTGLSRLRTRKVLRALRDLAGIPRRQLETEERRAALAIMRAHTPIRRLVSRHTRALLRRYFEAGMLAAPIAERRVEDRLIGMTADERGLYEAVEDYIASTWDQASADERSAVGFVMTVYRRRIASNFRALGATLERHLDAIGSGGDRAAARLRLASLDEDAPDDETADESLDAEEVAELERRALAAEERADVERLLTRLRGLPPDSKLAALKAALAALREAGCEQAMVFTQYTDTMDFLRDELRKGGERRLMCFSGRGGEVPAGGGGGSGGAAGGSGAWRGIGRDDAKRRFRLGEADVLLCTAAAEGLDFQFCGALVNYDLPWNPMRVEQRIGRLDRLGQEHPVIRVVNLHYEGTVETDVCRALRERIGLFESVVGRLQPILSRLPRAISDAVLAGSDAGSLRDSGGGARVRPRSARTRTRRPGGRDRAAGARSQRGGRLRPRRGAGRGPRHAGPAPAPRHPGRPRPDRRVPLPDAAGNEGPADGAPRVRVAGPRNEGAVAGHHRPRLLRGARGERRAVVPGQPAVPPARASGPGLEPEDEPASPGTTLRDLLDR